MLSKINSKLQKLFFHNYWFWFSVALVFCYVSLPLVYFKDQLYVGTFSSEFFMSLLFSANGAFTVYAYFHKKFEKERQRWEHEKSNRELAALDRFRETISTLNRTHTEALKDAYTNRQDKSK